MSNHANYHPPVSIESIARQTPSRALAPPSRGRRIDCPCCHRHRGAGTFEHPTLGQLCDPCSIAFDYRLDADGVRLPIRDTCPFCLDGIECPSHDGW